ncbi:MAG: hypothetical protein R3F55_15475 [Alphaproteobacteria bacterium]
MSLPRSQIWRGIGYGLTAAWMIGILVVSGSDPAHPWFDYIFVVPLGGWIVGLGVARLLAGPPTPPPPDRPRPRDGSRD